MSSHSFDTEAWSKMTMFEQMGNIGSEVGRAMTAKRQQNKDRTITAFYRGLDLIDVTAKLWAPQRNGRLRELLRAREEFAKAIITDEMDTSLEKYFMNFAIASRLNKN